MKKVIVAALMTILCLPAVAMHKKKKKKKAVKATTTCAIQSVMIDKTACYGRCPTYSIKIDNTGLVTYTGKGNVSDSGVYTKNVGAKQTLAILNKLNSNRVDTCKKEYENMIPDLPGIIYTIKYKDSTKKIWNANWGPQFLKLAVVDIEDIGKVHDATWKKQK